ncbi:MAG: class I SAM-dependent methyltransferase, partial [Pseudomonadota bacterium]
MTSTDPQRDRLGREEWARFWARGTVTTFEGHFSGNYDQEIAEFWHQALEPLDDGACVVDLATGNGAVALLMAAWARTQNRSLAITGVDYAAVDPEQVRAARPELAADLDAITLIGGTPLEATTLDAGSVDLVSSQYGYEYGDTAAGSREIARILRPGGRLAMILHHSDSAILQQAQEGLAQLDFCINKTDFVRLGQRMAKLFRGLKPGGTGPGKLHWSPGAIKIRESLLDTAERVQKRGETPTARATDAGFIEFLLPSVMQIVERSRQTDDASLARVW